MTQKCRICQLDKSCLPLTWLDDDQDKITVNVCATCWDIIAQISIRTINHLKVNPAFTPVSPDA